MTDVQRHQNHYKYIDEHEKKKIALVMDNLTRIGAEDILVLDIHNAR